MLKKELQQTLNRAWKLYDEKGKELKTKEEELNNALAKIRRLEVENLDSTKEIAKHKAKFNLLKNIFSGRLKDIAGANTWGTDRQREYIDNL